MKMSRRTAKPSRWYYGLAALIPVFGCLIAASVPSLWLLDLDLPGTQGTHFDMEDLTRVIVPGSQEITFDRSGAYAIYYEYRSVVDGQVYRSSASPPALACSLGTSADGASARIEPGRIQGIRYSSKDRDRVGVLLHSISVDEPGAYTLTCHYVDGRSEPEVVVAVGPNYVWEFFGLVARLGLPVLAGLLVLLGSVLVAALLAAATAFRRNRSAPAAASR
jgi:hypothetical protein